MAKNKGIEEDLIDWKHEVDPTLTYAENKTQLLKKIGQDVEYPKEQLKEIQKTQEKQIRKELLKDNTKPNKALEEYFIDIKEAIEQMKLGYVNLIFIKGRGGVGKSEQIRRYLNFYFKPNEIVSVTDVSEAYLYRLFCEHNGCIFWFKDVDKLLRTERSLLTLKTATETTPKRILTNYNYNAQNKDLPKTIDFTGKLIFDYNEITNLSNRQSFEALISRGEYVVLNFSFDDISNIMKQIAKDQEQKQITDWLIRNYKFVGHNQFNLRTQHRAFMWYKYCQSTKKEWKGYMKRKLKSQMTPIQILLYAYMGNKTVQSNKLKKYLIKCGAVNTMRTADRRINEWIELEELYKHTHEKQNFLVSLKPKGLLVR